MLFAVSRSHQTSESHVDRGCEESGCNEDEDRLHDVSGFGFVVVMTQSAADIANLFDYIARQLLAAMVAKGELGIAVATLTNAAKHKGYTKPHPRFQQAKEVGSCEHGKDGNSDDCGNKIWNILV